MGQPPGLAELARASVGDRVALPQPNTRGAMSVEETISRRRSIREFAPEPLTLDRISQLLWAAAGLTPESGSRAAPSAGACYPLDASLVCEQGMFSYVVDGHALIKRFAEDLRSRLAAAAYGQHFVGAAPISIVFAAVFERTTGRYGDRGIRYVYMDVGHAAENVHLQAEALGLGSVPVGAFDDEAVADVLGLSRDQRPIYIVSAGRPARG